MPKTKSEIPTSELVCIICPKKPRFSDLSHLLTHIASKAHLSHMHNLTIDARTRQSSKDLVEEYDDWKTANNLDQYLGERQAAKAAKKATKGNTVKKEPESITSKSLAPSFRAPNARMHPTPSMDDFQSPVRKAKNRTTVYSTPTTRSKVPHFSGQGTPSGNRLDQSPSTPWKPDPESVAVSKSSIDEDSESAFTELVLKGQKLEGMGGFDSATPEGKRKRNQKKDERVFKDLVAVSASIEPLEITYYANGDLKSSRDVRLPDPISPSLESSLGRFSPKKQRNTRKSNLRSETADGGRPRVTRSKKATARAAAVAPVVLKNAPTYQVRSRAQSALTHNIGGYTDLSNARRYMPRVEEDDEYDEYALTTGRFGHKSDFGVFKDKPSPGRTESPLEEPRFEFNGNHGLPMTWQSNSNLANRIMSTPTPAAKAVQRNTNGINGLGLSENSVMGSITSMNTMVGGGHHGQVTPNAFHPGRRALSDGQVFAPHVFQTNHHLNPLFHNGNGLDRPYSPYAYAYLFGNQHHQSRNSHNMQASGSGFTTNYFETFQSHNTLAGSTMGTQTQVQSHAQPPSSLADMGPVEENDVEFQL